MKNEISLVFDFLDPWGWVAERRLRLAMRKAQVRGPITYLPCRSSWSRNAIGRHFGNYQQLRFGSQAETHGKRLIAQASSLGLELDVLNVQRIPDPGLAMIALTHEHRHAPELFDAIYTAIFRDGLDIANVDVMAELLQACSADINIAALMNQRFLSDELIRHEQVAAQWSRNLIPCIRIDGIVVSGAQPASILEPLLERLNGGTVTPADA